MPLRTLAKCSHLMHWLCSPSETTLGVRIIGDAPPHLALQGPGEVQAEGAAASRTVPRSNLRLRRLAGVPGACAVGASRGKRGPALRLPGSQGHNVATRRQHAVKRLFTMPPKGWSWLLGRDGHNRSCCPKERSSSVGVSNGSPHAPLRQRVQRTPCELYESTCMAGWQYPKRIVPSIATINCAPQQSSRLSKLLTHYPTGTPSDIPYWMNISKTLCASSGSASKEKSDPRSATASAKRPLSDSGNCGSSRWGI